MKRAFSATCAVLFGTLLVGCQTSQVAVSSYSGASQTNAPVKTAFNNDATSSALTPEERAAALGNENAAPKSPDGDAPSIFQNDATSSAMTAEERRAKREEAEETRTAMLPGVKWNTRGVDAAIKPKTAERETATNGKRLTPIQAMNARASKYSGIIRRHAKANGVPYRLAKAIVQVESNFKEKARGAAGEIGLMQLMPTTARYIGYKGKMGALYNPETNIKYGMKYLGKAHRLGGGSTCGTILKYNAGHGAKRMNPISRKYCARVKRIMARS